MREMFVRQSQRVLFGVLVGWIFAFALAEMCLAMTIFSIPSAIVLRDCLVFSLLLNLIFFHRRTALVAVCGVGVALLITLFALWRGGFQADWYQNLNRLILEIVWVAIREISPREELVRFIGRCICFGVSLLGVIGARLRAGVWALAAVAVYAVALSRRMNWKESPGAIALFAICILLLLLREMNCCAAKGVERSQSVRARHALLLLPACSIVFFAASQLPQPVLEWKPSSPGGSTLGSMQQSAGGVFSYHSESGEMGGPVAPGGGFVMEVDAVERVYLSGNVYDRYTGSSWQRTRDESVPLEPEESGLYLTGDYSEEMQKSQQEWRRFLGRNMQEVTVYTGDNRFGVIFSPPFRTDLQIPQTPPVRQNRYGMVIPEQEIGRQSEYTQSYISFGFTNMYFIEILRDRSLWDMDLSAQELALSEEERADYLQLPESLPDRVRELSRELTERAETDYDKLKAIERHLASFPYTLAPGEVPPGADFVDHFLFEEQQGYCVYYASAMTVLARAADIPTRYVEGYVMPSERSANGNFTVTGEQAHAWVESYFKGLGWVRFEPTSSYYARAYGEAPPTRAEAEAELRGEVLPEQPAPEPIEKPEAPKPAPAPDPEPLPEQAGGGIWRPLLVTALILALLFLCLRRLAARYWARQAERFGLPSREGAREWFSCALRAAALLGYPIRTGETAIGYARRMAAEEELRESGIDFATAAEAFSKAQYSELPVSGEERDAVKECHQSIVRAIRADKKNRLRFAVERYLLLRF